MSMEDVRKAFEAASDGQLRLAHAEMHYTADGKQVLSFAGFKADGSPFSIATEPFMGSLVLKAMSVARGLLTQAPQSTPPLVLTSSPQNPNTTQGLGQFDRSVAKATQEVNRMGKLAQIAQRAPQVVKELEARADKLGPRLDALEKRGNATFDKWEGHLGEQEAAISEAENAINQLSNGAPGPLSAS